MKKRKTYSVSFKTKVILEVHQERETDQEIAGSMNFTQVSSLHGRVNFYPMRMLFSKGAHPKQRTTRRKTPYLRKLDNFNWMLISKKYWGNSKTRSDGLDRQYLHWKILVNNKYEKLYFEPSDNGSKLYNKIKDYMKFYNIETLLRKLEYKRPVEMFRTAD